ncbi:phosphoenolpyruvate--protein phosphotransferase [Aquisphaera insulae]|uniref:phosphoenolpyruvate--protein phosphotransferase n=1 Tax=Aquisphaera insulae TaxID=2712864 RepID=UPI00196ABEF4|nr:phosphoenolpyruvate--protein phosphotransferase [Aquisphaera insulae]
MPPLAPPHQPDGPTPAAPPMQVLRGLAVSPGIAIGPVVVASPVGRRLPPRKIAREAVAAEKARLDRALEAAEVEADQACAEARDRLGPQYADILGAHARMIGDPTLREGAGRRIEQETIAAEHAVIEVLEAHAARLEQLSDSYLAARAADVRDIEARILGQLMGRRPRGLQDELPGPSLVLAADLSPSETAGLDPRRVLGFATEAGGRASHTAIVAAALEIPAVVGLGKFLDLARQCRIAIIDGDEGLVILDPDAATQERYRDAAEERSERFQVLSRQADLPAETLDGTRLELWGNIEFSGEVEACLGLGAAGVGLYRTEFLFMNAEAPPTEEQQFEAYATVIRSLQGRPIVIRTLDLGADKLESYRASAPREANPFLGLRSIRLSLRDRDLFRPQLRAILRAALLGDVRIMFPLVSTMSELRQARALLAEAAAGLAAEGIPGRGDLPVGVMVEVPAAALVADHLAKEVDFFSIGTNDLVQYTLAVDRTNETVADLYSAADPAVLRLIERVVQAAGARGIDVSVCGTMGGDPLYAMLLLGLGLRHLSMPPHQLPEIRRVIRGIRLDAARALAAEALAMETAAEVADLLQRRLREALPDTPPRSGAPRSEARG